MGLKDKIQNAKKNDWITNGFSKAETKSIVELAQISARIERRRIELGMTQKQFADFMGVTQGMVSKWESRDYNFTIKSLNEICEKIGLEFRPSIDSYEKKDTFTLMDFISETDNYGQNKWISNINLENREEIAC
ncbi:helix-turn-helix domain-containing protein [Butyrivibrio sp. WCD3002]|uniref:helix-turn-helix domain-containing protein n=1 Tax=Butyrivibrio sp. WCD3002 TaxID=1280676 RepID=UPI00041B3B5F|nr:helix-turn-helix transcriptional regulator [Butyrivibrio sp. WCD3002]